MTPHPVTDHAVARWLERVRGLDLDALCPPGSIDRVRALAGCRILGISLAEARDLVCPPRLHAGLNLGRGGVVRGADRVLRIVGGRIVTVLPVVPPTKAQPRARRVAPA